MYIHVYVYIYTYMYIYTEIDSYTYIYTYKYIHMNIYVHIHDVYIHAYLCIHSPLHSYTCICIYTHTQVQLSPLIGLHIYIHTSTYNQVQIRWHREFWHYLQNKKISTRKLQYQKSAHGIIDWFVVIIGTHYKAHDSTIASGTTTKVLEIISRWPVPRPSLHSAVHTYLCK